MGKLYAAQIRAGHYVTFRLKGDVLSFAAKSDVSAKGDRHNGEDS
jgi:hypothetical protein